MNDLIKFGKVVSNNINKKTARVQFSDNDGVVSYDLHMLFRRTARDKDCGGLPDIGENVLCLFLPNGDEVGFIIGSYYNDEHLSPENEQNKTFHWITDGGAEVYLDRETGELHASGVTTAIINATESITATAPNVVVDGDVIISGNLLVEGGSELKGKVDMSSGASISGIEFDTHAHGGIERGEGISDGPQ